MLRYEFRTPVPQAERSGLMEGGCGAFFLMQRVRAGSLLTGSWHKSKWSALAYGNDSSLQSGEDEEAGEEQAGGEEEADGAKTEGVEA